MSGAWAITAGIVQLVVAVSRRALGGQWPLILSGGTSVLAGPGFIVQSGGSAASLTGLAGYAPPGACSSSCPRCVWGVARRAAAGR